MRKGKALKNLPPTNKLTVDNFTVDKNLQYRNYPLFLHSF